MDTLIILALIYIVGKSLFGEDEQPTKKKRKGKKHRSSSWDSPTYSEWHEWNKSHGDGNTLF